MRRPDGDTSTRPNCPEGYSIETIVDASPTITVCDCVWPVEMEPIADSLWALGAGASSAASVCGALLTSGLMMPKTACDFYSEVCVASRLAPAEPNGTSIV